MVAIGSTILAIFLAYRCLLYHNEKVENLKKLRIAEQKNDLYRRQQNFTTKLTGKNQDTEEGGNLIDIAQDIINYLDKNEGPFCRLSLINAQDPRHAQILAILSNSELSLKEGDILDVTNFSSYPLLIQGKANVVNDLASSDQLSDTDKIQLNEGVKSYASIPLNFGDQLIGVFNISSPKSGHFSQEMLLTIIDLVKPLVISLYQAQEYQNMASNIEKLDKKNKKAWQMSLAIHKQKEEIEEKIGLIQKEKEKLEKEKEKIKERNKKLWETSVNIHNEKERIEKIKIQIEQKHKDITASIAYAERIQRAIMPNQRVFERYFADFFIFFKPRDVVSGDFFWATQKDDYFIWTAADCTGHGVPGAFMSMIGVSLLNKTVIENGITNPEQILENLRLGIMDALHQHEMHDFEQQKDGMDLHLCRLNIKTLELTTSGANNPLYIVRGQELIELKGQKQPVGYYFHSEPFRNNSFQLNKGDLIYVFSDGFADQFGGDKGKKLKYRPFKDTLLSISSKPLIDQLDAIDDGFRKWKGTFEQVDDVCIIGVKI